MINELNNISGISEWCDVMNSYDINNAVRMMVKERKYRTIEAWNVEEPKYRIAQFR